MIGTMLEEMQQNIHLLPEGLREWIPQVASKLTTKSKKWWEEVRKRRLLEKGEPTSLSDLDSTSSKEDETIFTDATIEQGEKEVKKAIPKEPTE